MERRADAEEPISMASIIEQMDASEVGADDLGPRKIRRGEIVEGVVASIDRDGILIDIGGKSEGTVAQDELPALLTDPDAPKVGDEVLAYVILPFDREGRAVLSLRQGQAERAWRMLEQAMQAGKLVEAPVTDANRGGLIVDVHGLRGFVPMSQISGGRQEGSSEEEIVARLQAYVGRTLGLKVVEINRKRSRLILSERLAQQEERSRRKDELVSHLREGEIRQGRVTSVTDFGAFVDIGGADGLVHLSELSWQRVARASDVVRVGDTIDVMVIGIDHERKKIALSLRRTQPEPWALATQKYQVGDIVEGTITKLATFGAFARIEDGIEGLIHISELSEGRVVNPRQIVEEGEQRRMRILRIEPDRRRLALSLRNVDSSEEDADVGFRSYGYDDQHAPTIGEAFGGWDEQEDRR